VAFSFALSPRAAKQREKTAWWLRCSCKQRGKKTARPRVLAATALVATVLWQKQQSLSGAQQKPF
jgi:hypothetical protein